MESTNLRIENWESGEIEEISYSASLRVPPKDELLRLLPTHLSSLTYPWVCRTGLLCKTEHSLKLCLYREYHEPKIGVYVSIKNPPDSGRIIEMRGIDVSYVSQSTTSTSVDIDDNMKKLDPPKPMEILDTEFWQSTIGWPDQTCILYLVFNVVKRKPPLIVNDDIGHELASSETSSPAVAVTSPTYNGLIDVNSFFLSQECSDVTIRCGRAEFPAHLLILCSRSKYFAAMFSSRMKEANDRVVQIEDMSPESVKELLRFMYLGEIESPTLFAKDLFIAGDKYGMEDLRELCERHLVQGLSPQNALEMFDLCQMHGSPVLLRKAKQVILWNKGKFAPDPETLKAFTCKYPELVFELLKFDS